MRWATANLESLSFLRRFPVIAIAILLLIPVLIAVVLPLHVTEPGLYLRFLFYDVREGRLVEVSEQLRTTDLSICIHGQFVSPREPRQLVFKCFRPTPGTVLIPYERIEPLISEWVGLLTERNVPKENIENHEVGLILSTLVVNTTSRKVIYHILDSIPLRLGDFIKPQAVLYTIYAIRGVHQIQYEKRIGIAPLINVGVAEASDTGGALSSRYVISGQAASMSSTSYCQPAGEGFELCYDLIAEAKPEDMLSYLPDSYFRTASGILYIKAPVMIVYNKYYYSGVVVASIVLGIRDVRVTTRLTFSSGEIVGKLKNGDYPTVNLELGRHTWGGTNYYYGMAFDVYPEESWWAYIWARPIKQYWNVTLCSYWDWPPLCTYFDEARSFISDILVYGTTIDGSYEAGLPHSVIMDSFYAGTKLKGPQWIPGTHLEDGKLDPGESITLEQIIKYFDTCGAGFEVGIPAGAIFAKYVCPLLGPTGAGISVCIAFASAFMLSLEYEPASIYSSGVLCNRGARSGRGYDIYEYVYMRVSSYAYSHKSCYFDVPASIYFELY